MSSPGNYLPIQDLESPLLLEYAGNFSAGTSLQPLEDVDGVALLAEDGGRRTHLRNPVEACRPIAVQMLDEHGEPASAWYLADILDVSVGGFCLLITEDQPMPLAQLMRLRLDVRPHPAFGAPVVGAELRWFVRAGFVVTLGVGFDQPLAQLPALLPCRRGARRELDVSQALL
ncbi:MAG: PilZ domain-containing protein [Synechococcus sp.]|nr:PilZ domain-containing protein [Synechococcus sp.]